MPPLAKDLPSSHQTPPPLYCGPKSSLTNSGSAQERSHTRTWVSQRIRGRSSFPVCNEVRTPKCSIVPIDAGRWWLRAWQYLALCVTFQRAARLEMKLGAPSAQGGRGGHSSERCLRWRVMRCGLCLPAGLGVEAHGQEEGAGIDCELLAMFMAVFVSGCRGWIRCCFGLYYLL